MIQIESDWSEVEALLDYLLVQPSPKVTGALAGVLAAGYALAVADVHVETGSLKSSLKSDEITSYVQGHWEGTLRAGGPSAGVHDPVNYAIYEQRRGGLHDFFGALPGLDPAWITAIEEGLYP